MAKGDTINASFGLFMEDFDRDTLHLSLEEQMIYVRALTYIWKHGFIPAEEKQFARLTGASMLRRWRLAVVSVQSQLQEHAQLQGMYTQKRVERDRQEYLQNRAKERDKKRNQRGMSPGTDPGTPPGPITSPSPITSPNDSSNEESIPPDPQTNEPNEPARPEYADWMFEDFKEYFPKRNLPHPWAKAEQTFKRLIEKGTELNLLLVGAVRYRQAMEAEDQIGTPYVCQATTFLNQERWKDYPPIDEPEESAHAN